MDSVRAVVPFRKHPDDNGQYGFIFEDAIDLPAGLTISSVDTATVTVEEGTDVALDTLTLGAGTPNSSTFTDDDGATVPIGKAVLSNMSKGVNGVNYAVKWKATLS